MNILETKKLYQEDVYLKETSATVTNIKGDLIYLDQTLFFPTGGGQTCDEGFINNIEVIDVNEEGNLVSHKVKSNNFKIGDTVTLKLNWEKRFDNMQRHCGEHILSGIFHKLYGGVNRGFHMGDEYMTIDISLEDDPNFTKLDFDMAIEAEKMTNQVIWDNLPVITRRFEKKEDAAALPLRKPLAIDEEITIVSIGSIHDPSDCVACCGTHPSSAGQVGLVKIYKVENNKGMFRVYFEAGARALADYDKKHDLLVELGNRYSAGTNDLMKKIKATEDKHKETKAQLNKLRQSVINSRIDEISEDIEILQEDGASPSILVYQYDDMNIDSLLNIGRPLSNKIPKLLIIVSAEDHTVLLFSKGDIDCGKLVKENAPIYQGKGGGNQTSARAMFTSKTNVETFIDLLDKHLR
ncbi:MAG: alanine--tRNA ligase-related protein [Anaerovoracaceae bacterium]